MFRQEVMAGAHPFASAWERITIPYSKLGASAASYKLLKDTEVNLPRAYAALDEMTPPERGYAILEGHWQGRYAKYRKLHPIERAKAITAVVSTLQREIVADLFHSGKKTGITRQPIAMTPTEKTAARDILTQYKAMELYNALVLTKEVGWEKRSYLPASDVLRELEVAVPRVYAEVQKRFKKANVLPWNGVREVWPEVKAKLESPEILSRVKQGEKVQTTFSLVGEWGQAKFAQ